MQIRFDGRINVALMLGFDFNIGIITSKATPGKTTRLFYFERFISTPGLTLFSLNLNCIVPPEVCAHNASWRLLRNQKVIQQ